MEMTLLLIGGVIGFACGFMGGLQWKIVDVRTRKERRRESRWARQERKERRKQIERFGAENVRGGG